MNITQILNQILDKQSLSSSQMHQLMNAILSGELEAAQIAGLLIGLRAKGETVEEIIAASSVLCEKMLPVTIDDKKLLDDAVDIVGTGGDGQSLFNVSTASALVAAAASVPIAKHGNRSVSSQTGAADVLEAMGVSLDITANQIAQCIATVGIGFMFAPVHHSAMRFAMPARRSLGVRTLFNLLGPLCNPARVKRQVLGVYSQEWLQPLAEVLRDLGATHCLLVHSSDGLDEISIAAPTHIVELKAGNITSYSIAPDDFNFLSHPLAELRVSNADASYRLITTALQQPEHPAAKMIALNAGAAIYVGGQVETLMQGVQRAQQVMATDQPMQTINNLAATTQRMAASNEGPSEEHSEEQETSKTGTQP